MGVYSGNPEQPAVGIRVGIVASRFNREIVEALVDSATAVYQARGGVADYLTTAWVPGAFELPLASKRMAEAHTLDVVVALGAVIRGDTPHFDYVAGECARGLQSAALETRIPMIFGVLTVDTLEQAQARIKGGEVGDKGAEAMEAALEMVSLLRTVPGGGTEADTTAWIRAGE